ncbi:hypothetical protein BJ165DRAFT_1535710 [Panaeolus papilionaceus]|nr:hypothetical protein BJ165DRAFT_1535710 [Panaeolus papilionaceus]
MKALEPQMRHYSQAAGGTTNDGTPPDLLACHVVIWSHDESVFYTHDQQQTRWVHESEQATPYKKGKGASLMVADFILVDYGWLASLDRKESAQVILQPEKNQDGHYPDEDHVLVFDNATTHLK